MGSRLLLTRIRENSACILLSPVLQTETSTLPQGIVQTLQNLCISRNSGLIAGGLPELLVHCSVTASSQIASGTCSVSEQMKLLAPFKRP